MQRYNMFGSESLVTKRKDQKEAYAGTTSWGGAANAGVVYKLNASGNETVLYSFTGGADGGNPNAGVIRDSAGNLYGTTTYGGALGAGVVYKLNASSNETVLYSFTGGADGKSPYAGVIRDSAGNLYGTTYWGGMYTYGVVYKLDRFGKETVLHSFMGGQPQPYAGVIRDSAGNLYGTSESGGDLAGCNGDGCGVVYKLDTAGNYTVLYSFTGGADGSNPNAGVIRDSAANLYGTTPNGGTANAGVVYKLDTAGNYTVLYSFTGGADGSNPNAGVIRDLAGNLYGTTTWGGASLFGVVFKLNGGNLPAARAPMTWARGRGSGLLSVRLLPGSGLMAWPFGVRRDFLRHRPAGARRRRALRAACKRHRVPVRQG